MTTCIVGWNHLAFGRHTERDVESLICEAASGALADAGVAPEDVDAIYLGWYNGGFSRQDFGSSRGMNGIGGLRSTPAAARQAPAG